MTTTQGETLTQATVEPIEPPTEEHLPINLTDQDDLNNTFDQQDWWDDANVSELIDLEDFHCFLYSYDQLLEDSNFDGDDNEVISHALGTNTKLSPDEQLKLR